MVRGVAGWCANGRSIQGVNEQKCSPGGGNALPFFCSATLESWLMHSHFWMLFRQSGVAPVPAMYVVELSLRLTPMPIAVQRKELEPAQALYEEIGRVLESGTPKLLELTCEKDPQKRIRLLTSEVVAVQIFEKSTVGGSGKRPGFSFEG